MKGAIAFIFFMLFLAGIAFVNLSDMRGGKGIAVTTPEELTDVAWRPTRLGEMAIEEDTKMYLQFDNDGRIGGHAGCNRYFGGYRFDADSLIFGMVGATRMACGEPADSFEISYLEALQNTRGAVRSEDRLALRDASGDTLVRLVAIERIDD
jgi:heat shock protein HslJ